MKEKFGQRMCHTVVAALLVFGLWCYAKEAGARGLPARSRASSITIGVDASHPLLVYGKDNKLYLRVRLRGLLTQQNRPPVNLALVIDRSSSMLGDKIKKAKEAAKLVVGMLKPYDILSIVVYSTNVEVLVPATKVSNKLILRRKIDKIRADGFTALFAGVSKGLAEVRKFLKKERVNRVVLLSDGMANIGPKSPNALGRLGLASAKEGIAITTVGLGLGYNEDLMTQLALKSDGNHGFAKDATELERIFRAELGNVLSVVAQRLRLKVQFTGKLRPIRVLDREAEVRGQSVTVKLNQIYARQEKFVLIEVDAGKVPSVAYTYPVVATLRFLNTEGKEKTKLKYYSRFYFVKDAAKAHRAVNRQVMIQVVGAIANENNRRAVALRDRGKLIAARRLLQGNALYLQRNGQRYSSNRLKRSGLLNLEDSKNLEGAKWRFRRKRMRKLQYRTQNQTTW